MTGIIFINYRRSVALIAHTPRFFAARYCTVLFLSLGTLSSPIYNAENGVSTFAGYHKNLPSYALAGILLLAGFLFICWQILSIGKKHALTDRTKAATGKKTWILGIFLPLSLLLLPAVILSLKGNSLLPEWLPFERWPLRGFLAIVGNVRFYPLPLAWFAAIEIQRSLRNQPGHSISFSHMAATVSLLSSLCLFILVHDYSPSEFHSSWFGSLILPGLLTVSCGLLIWFLFRTGAQQEFKRYIIQSCSLLIPHAAVVFAVFSLLPNRSDTVLAALSLVSLVIFVGMIAAIRWFARHLQVSAYLRQSRNHTHFGH